MDAKAVAGVAELPQSSDFKWRDGPTTLIDPAESAGNPALCRTFGRVVFPSEVSIEEVIANSFRDFHVKGFDYICLRRSPTETIKVYFFDGDVSKLPEIVNPHDHRYNFDTLCVAGAVENIMFAPADHGGQIFNEFEYRTPLNGGNGFRFVQQRRLSIAGRDTFLPGQSYSLGYRHVHTIRMVENETVIALAQYEDRVPVGHPTRTWMRDRMPPSLDGLYRRFDADTILHRLSRLRARMPGLILPRIAA